MEIEIDTEEINREENKERPWAYLNGEPMYERDRAPIESTPLTTYVKGALAITGLFLSLTMMLFVSTCGSCAGPLLMEALKRSGGE